MKIYAKIESKVLFIDEVDYKEVVKKYEEKYTITILDTIYYDDGNILKVELLKAYSRKDYMHLLRY